MKSNLSLYLWEAVVIWYTDFLNNVKKTKLRSDFYFWCETLQTWFHENSAVMLKKLFKFKYTHQNVQNQVFVNVYIIKVIHHMMICSQTEYSVLLTTWQEINVKMQVHISQFIKIIIKQEFIKIMKNQHFNWKSMFINFQSIHEQNFKSVITSVKSFYNSYLYYQSSKYISYSQFYLMLIYQQDE